ncbi:MAG: glycosyltransferase family 2 protein [Candidatus Omnitrophota bacterium]
MNNPKVSVVIPVYNEEKNIHPLYNSLKAVLEENYRDSYEIIFVDDGSRDSSSNSLAELQKNDPRMVVISFRKNFGQTAALSAGFEHARGTAIVTMDADLQNDPKDIPVLLEKLNEFDLVSGWRYPRKDPFLRRRLPSLLANLLISWVTGVKLHDYGCTLKAFRSEVVKNIRLYGEMHRFIPAIASWMGVSVAEVKVVHHSRKFGKSKYGLRRTMSVLLDLISVKFLLTYWRNPIRIFGFAGIISGIAGSIILSYMGYIKIFLGLQIGNRPIVLLGILLILLGIQLFAIGLLGEMLAGIHREALQKPSYAIKKITGPDA